MQVWIDDIEEPAAPDVLYPVEFVNRLAKQNPGCVITAVWKSRLGHSYGDGLYIYDPTHELVGSRWRSKDKRDVAANHNQERVCVYVENFNGRKGAALRVAGRNYTAIVRLLDNKVDRHERIA